jgi:hypothetical protein
MHCGSRLALLAPPRALVSSLSTPRAQSVRSPVFHSPTRPTSCSAVLPATTCSRFCMPAVPLASSMLPLVSSGRTLGPALIQLAAGIPTVACWRPHAAHPATCCAVDRDSPHTYATAGDDGAVLVWDVRASWTTPTMSHFVAIHKERPPRIHCMDLRPGWIAAGGCGWASTASMSAPGIGVKSVPVSVDMQSWRMRSCAFVGQHVLWCTYRSAALSSLTGSLHLPWTTVSVLRGVRSASAIGSDGVRGQVAQGVAVWRPLTGAMCRDSFLLEMARLLLRSPACVFHRACSTCLCAGSGATLRCSVLCNLLFGCS